MINSQLSREEMKRFLSISKGMGDQFSAGSRAVPRSGQYIKGDG